MERVYQNHHWDVVQFGAFPSVNPTIFAKTESSLQGSHDESLLSSACSQGKLDIVKHLVEEGTDINQKDVASLTPIVRAAVNGHRNIVEFLIKHGAKISYSLLCSVKARIEVIEENAKTGIEDPYSVIRWKNFLDYLLFCIS